MANINKIRLSGTTYNIEDENAAKSVTLTQAEYDALVSGGTVDPNTFYIISDSSIAYMTSADTESAITQAVSGKQDTLVSGTNIKTINNQSLLGSGNISIQASGISSVEADYDDSVEPNGEFDILINDGSSYSQIFIVGDGLQVTENNGNKILSATGGGISSGEVQTMIDSSISGKTNQSDFSAHTANTSIHVTTAQTAAWDAKSNFSGSYNDLIDKPTIPTVPTSNTAFTNDAGHITIDAISGKVDTTTYTAYTAATDTALSGKQDTLSAGTNITIVDNVISAEGGGKAVSAGTNISITTGETADTINCTLNARNGTGTNSFIYGSNQNLASGNQSHSEGYATQAIGQGSHSEGYYSKAEATWSHSEGESTTANGSSSHSEGRNTTAGAYGAHSEGYGTSANAEYSHTEGAYTVTNNKYEHSQGQYNNSVSASTTFGNSGNTLFSVGNGTANNARHNAFEIRQNGDIYLTKDGQDVKLQDHLGGGGGGITSGEVQTMIDESVSGKANSSDSTYSVIANIQNDGIYFATLNKDGSQIDYSFEPQIRFQAPLYSDYNDGKVKISGVTAVTSASTDSEIPTAKAVNDKLGGLSLVKLTQAEYDALATKDSNTLYVING